MIKILVIGNGFDKAHGLKTGYDDFLEWIQYIGGAYDADIVGGLVKVTTEQLKESREFRQKYPAAFQEFLDYKENFWIYHFIKIQGELGDKWLDFENEIEIFAKRVYEACESNGISSCKSMLRRACDKDINIPTFVNKEELFEWLLLNLRKMTRLLEIYLCLCANKTINRESRLSLFTDIKANKLLSFNYTSTYKDVYNQAISADYIHGRASLDKKVENCDLVLGFDDHYFETADTVPLLIPFEKYYQRIVYRNSNAYFSWMDKKDKDGQPEKKEVHFYGHSLSPADGDIIKLLIEGENTKSKIYYRKGYEQDRANMIKNLAIILSPNGLISRMGGLNPTIELIAI